MSSKNSEQESSSDPSATPAPARGMRQSLAAWCSALRLPNLLTVPGDPVAGGILAAATLGIAPDWNAIRSSALASLCLYSAGLLANDFFDRKQDATERPERPLPSGKLQPNPVLAGAALLTAGGISFAAQAGNAALTVALVLTLVSWSYNRGIKRCPVVGPLFMGACRTLSLLLGAAGVASFSIFTPTILIPAATLGLLIASITSLARRETEVVRFPFWQISLPPVVLLAGLSAILFNHPLLAARGAPFTLALAAMPVVWTALLASQFFGSPHPAIVQRNIGGMIRGLILFQAALCASTGGIGEIAALIILTAFPVSGWLGKCFQGS